MGRRHEIKGVSRRGEGSAIRRWGRMNDAGDAAWTLFTKESCTILCSSICGWQALRLLHQLNLLGS